MKKDYRTLGAAVRDSGVQIISSSILLVKGKGIDCHLIVAIQQIVAGLVPQAGVWLLRPWDSLCETWSAGG